METSAKCGDNITEAFRHMAHDIKVKAEKQAVCKIWFRFLVFLRLILLLLFGWLILIIFMYICYSKIEIADLVYAVKKIGFIFNANCVFRKCKFVICRWMYLVFLNFIYELISLMRICIYYTSMKSFLIKVL